MIIEALKQIIEWTPAAINQYCDNISQDFFQEIHALGLNVKIGHFDRPTFLVSGSPTKLI